MMPGLFQICMLFILLSGVGLLQPLVFAGDKDIYNQAQHALDQKQYRYAQKLFSQLNSTESLFGEGTACYRVKDYVCAQRAFAAVAWASSDKQKRAKAVFNLANSYFFTGNYDQAIVLYRDSELLGIAPDLIANNSSYAKSLQSAMQRHVQQLQQGFKRALWKAAASGDKTPTLSEFLFNNESYLSVEVGENSVQTLYKVPEGVVQFAMMQQLGLTNIHELKAVTKWIETERILPQSTAKMINRLFEMELGINAILSQPQIVEGKRKW